MPGEPPEAAKVGRSVVGDRAYARLESSPETRTFCAQNPR